MVTYRTDPVQLRFVDGLRYDDKDNERLVAEMSGGANIDNGQHAADDTLKVIHSLTCMLKADARNCPRASISTFKELKAFGIRTVETTMILSEMYIDDDFRFIYQRIAQGNCAQKLRTAPEAVRYGRDARITF